MKIKSLTVMALASGFATAGFQQFWPTRRQADSAERTLALVATSNRLHHVGGRGYFVAPITQASDFVAENKLGQIDWDHSSYAFKGADRTDRTCVLARATSRRDPRVGFCADANGAVFPYDESGHCPLEASCQLPPETMTARAPQPAAAPAARTADSLTVAERAQAVAAAPQAEIVTPALIESIAKAAPAGGAERPEPEDAPAGFRSCLAFDLADTGLTVEEGATLDRLDPSLGMLVLDAADGPRPFRGFWAFRAFLNKAVADGNLAQSALSADSLTTGDLARLDAVYGLRMQTARGVFPLTKVGISEIALSVPQVQDFRRLDERGNKIAREDGADFIRLNGTRGKYALMALRDRSVAFAAPH